jgi:ppGpp synthetase/RelA/SpoT-type nucleotidyltranferase
VSVSNSQADRAAVAFLQSLRLRPGSDEERRRVIEEALAGYRVMGRYRAAHAYPLKKVTMGVRVMVATELGDDAPRPGQRFKRMDRIIDKLRRYDTMRLSQMEDIGGCRVVLGSLDEVYAVVARLRRRWRVGAVDYIAHPKPDGYRGVHVIERRDGCQVEVQVRTERQHGWAQAVEDALSLTGYNVKDGDGPDDLRLYFRLAAKRLALEDRGDPPDDALEARFATLREQIRHYYLSWRSTTS